MHKRTKKFCEH